MEFDENPDHAAIRDAVATVAAKYGGGYYTEHAERHLPTTELWAELGRQGSSGSTSPRSTAAAAPGITELALVCEETAAQGCPAAPAARVERHLRRGPHPLRHRRQKQDVAARHGRRASARWPSRSPSRTPAPTRTRSSTTARRDGDGWRAARHQVLHLRRGRGRRADRGGPHRHRRDDREGPAVAVPGRRPTRPGLARTQIPVSTRQLPEKQFTLFFDDVAVGGRPARRRRGRRACARCSTA